MKSSIYFILFYWQVQYPVHVGQQISESRKYVCMYLLGHNTVQSGEMIFTGIHSDIQDDRTLHDQCCENLKSYSPYSYNISSYIQHIWGSKKHRKYKVKKMIVNLHISICLFTFWGPLTQNQHMLIFYFTYVYY
jgi:hypothetical protein